MNCRNQSTVIKRCKFKKHYFAFKCLCCRYDFMQTCWNADQFERPVFSKCVDFLEEHITRFNVHILEQIHIKLEEASRGQAEIVNWTRR